MYKNAPESFPGSPLVRATAEGTGSIPGQGTKILHAMWQSSPTSKKKNGPEKKLNLISSLKNEWKTQSQEVNNYVIILTE